MARCRGAGGSIGLTTNPWRAGHEDAADVGPGRVGVVAAHCEYHALQTRLEFHIVPVDASCQLAFLHEGP